MSDTDGNTGGLDSLIDPRSTGHAGAARTSLRRQRTFNLAAKTAKKAIDIRPVNFQYRHALAELFGAVASPTQVVGIYEEIMKRQPSDKRAFGRLNEQFSRTTTAGRRGPT